MSKLSGHKNITNQAVNELVRSNKEHSVISNLRSMSLKYSVTARDIFDVIQLGHWTNSGQRHHFMRSFDGQSHFNAYIDSTNWIKSNALHAANQLSDRIEQFELKNDGFSADSMRDGKHAIAGKPPVRSTLNKHKTKTDHVSWLTLAYACHALQDSLTKERDPAVDLINQHCTSIQLGDMNFKTMNMEEELLAKAILDEHPVQMDVVYDVFYRLDNHYSSDADDVASIYIKLVQDKAGSAVEQALKRHKKLVTLLVSVLDSGYTTGSEKSLIKYLQH